MSSAPTSTKVGTEILSSPAMMRSSAWASTCAAPARPLAERCLLARTSSLCPSREPAGLEFGGALLCPLVPGAAGLGLTKPRPGVEQHQRLDHRGMGEVEGERHIAAERETADDRALDPAAAQQCLHVLDGQRLGI